MIIGIDPDIKKSGVAVVANENIDLHNLTFFELFDFLKSNEIKLVVIEAGWLNKKSNWHKGYYNKGKLITNTNNINENISKKTGANHETGRKIVEMCVYLGIDYQLIKPTSKKVNTLFFEKLTGIKRSNQETRDAAMLILNIVKWKKKK